MAKNNSHPAQARQYDFIGLGEPLLRMSPPGFGQLRRAVSFNVLAAGAQMNVTANLARLGKKALFLTRLPANPLGELVVDSLASYGIDISQIKLIADSRIGITFVEHSKAPRIPLSVFDRAGSAASTIKTADFDFSQILPSAKYAYTDGIFSGLSASASQTAFDFLHTAKKHQVTTCFDMNYREHLWTRESAAEVWSRLLKNVDILVTNRNVSEQAFGFKGTDEEILNRYRNDFGCNTVCLTYREIFGLQKGAWNSMALHHRKMYYGRRKEFDIVDRYGTGDAWFSGFLYAMIEEKDIEYCLNFGNALCSLAHTAEGDVANFHEEEILNAMEENPDLRLKR